MKYMDGKELRSKILTYLEDTYQPSAMVLYGSFANGTNNEGSDFDALLITDKAESRHDASMVGNTVLDVFLYSPEEFRGDYDCEEYVQIYDGDIILDQNGIAARLKENVRHYIDHMPPKDKAEIRQSKEWCEKMLNRAQRGDAEGFFRWHWLLIDSLEIYFDIRGQYYFGPKKSLKIMEKQDPEAYRLYSRALAEFHYDTLREWIEFIARK